MDRVRKGEFVVPEQDLEAAQETFNDRNKQSKNRDRAFRGPITTDVETYQATNGYLFDYPGVDTPTDEPKQAIGDMPFPDENSFGGEMSVYPAAESDGIRESVENQVNSLFDSMFK